MDVNHGDYSTEAFPITMGHTQNEAKAFTFDTGNRANYSVPLQNSPTEEWIQSQRLMGTSGTSQNIDFRRQRKS